MKKIIITVFISLIYFSISFSQTWTEITSPVSSSIWNLTAFDNNYAWVGDFSETYRTTNGGMNWSAITLPGLTSKIYAYSQNDLFCIYNSSLRKSTNSGLNWYQVFSINNEVMQVKMLNAMTGYLIGRHSGSNPRFGLYKTIDGGWSWDSAGLYMTNTAGEPLSIFVLESYIWIGANNPSKVYFSTNNGNTWDSRIIGGYLQRGIWFNNISLGAVHTSGGQAWFTTNSGATWTPSAQPLNFDIISIIGSASKFFIITSGGSEIRATTNNGATWTTEYTASYGAFTTLTRSWFGDGSVWAGRNVGAITKGINIAGIKPISNNIPEKFSLSQNYPNPFNPKTKIRFDVAPALLNNGLQSIVQLKVYDVLGRETAILLNQQLKPGTYEVDFDGTNLPSGIYYYTLTTDTFTDTKKMVMIK